LDRAYDLHSFVQVISSRQQAAAYCKTQTTKNEHKDKNIAATVGLTGFATQSGISPESTKTEALRL